MERIEPERWGRDHQSVLLYLETRCVDYGGQVRTEQLRCNPTRHAYGGGVRWSDKYTTRLREGVAAVGHDDWDCIDDLVAAGLVIWGGTGANPVFRLTDDGWREAGRLRRARAEARS